MPRIVDRLGGRLDGGGLHRIPEESDRGRTVGYRVVDLHHHGDPSAGHTLDHQQFPQWPVAWQWGTGEDGDRSGELVIGAWTIEHKPTDVAPQIELGILQPDRVAQSPGHRNDSPAEWRKSDEQL